MRWRRCPLCGVWAVQPKGELCGPCADMLLAYPMAVLHPGDVTEGAAQERLRWSLYPAPGVGADGRSPGRAKESWPARLARWRGAGVAAELPAGYNGANTRQQETMGDVRAAHPATDDAPSTGERGASDT